MQDHGIGCEVVGERFARLRQELTTGVFPKLFEILVARSVDRRVLHISGAAASGTTVWASGWRASRTRGRQLGIYPGTLGAPESRVRPSLPQEPKTMSAIGVSVDRYSVTSRPHDLSVIGLGIRSRPARKARSRTSRPPSTSCTITSGPIVPT